MVEVRFYGSLKQFGTDFKLDVKDTAEALRALISQIKGLRTQIQQGFYKVRIGSEYIMGKFLEMGLYKKLKAGQKIHITPVVKGAKNGGIFQVVLGVALVGAAFALGPVGLGLLGSTTALMMGGMGALMLLGGVTQMLTKVPTMSTAEQQGQKRSTAFGNLQNMTAQGQPIPLAYGRIMCGSLIISQGVETYTVNEG